MLELSTFCQNLPHVNLVFKLIQMSVIIKKKDEQILTFGELKGDIFEIGTRLTP